MPNSTPKRDLAIFLLTLITDGLSHLLWFSDRKKLALFQSQLVQDRSAFYLVPSPLSGDGDAATRLTNKARTNAINESAKPNVNECSTPAAKAAVWSA